MEEPGFPMCLALKLMVFQDLTPEERAAIEKLQKAQKSWIHLEAFIVSIVYRKRAAGERGEIFSLTKSEARSMAQYLNHVQATAGNWLWHVIGGDFQVTTEDAVHGTREEKAPVTPVLHPAETTAWTVVPAAPVLSPAVPVPWMAGQAAGSADGPLPGGNWPSDAAIAAKARMSFMPPGLEDLPTFDRKSICSTLEIVIKGVDKMTEDEVRDAIDGKLGKNVGLAELHVIEGKNVGFARFWSADTASWALRELKGLKNPRNGRRLTTERCTFKKHHHKEEEK